MSPGREPGKRNPGRRARRAAEASPPERLGHRASLDGIRGFGVLSIMAWHFSLHVFIPGAFVTLDFFFVLSGFLITTLLLEEWDATGGIHLGRFYARRALRLFPALFLVLLVMSPFVQREYILRALFYVANWGVWTGHFPVSPIRHLWSLSVEEQFYIVWPMTLLILLKARAPHRFIYAFVALMALASCLTKVVMWHSPEDWIRLYHGSDTRADAILIGCLSGLFLHWSARARSRGFQTLVRVLVFPSIALILGLFVTAKIYWEFLYRYAGFTAAALSVAIVIVNMMTRPWPWLAAFLEWKPFAAIGRMSYGLYIWHQPVGWLTDPRNLGPIPWFSTLPWGYQFVGRFLLSFAIAGASYKFVEMPMLKLKRRFTSRRTA